MPRKPKTIERRAIRVVRGEAAPVFQFTLRLEELLAVADISRVEGMTLDNLVQYQRQGVRTAVDKLAEIANSNDRPFPYPITLALSSQVRFRQSRGPAVGDGNALGGTLEIPIGEPDTRKVGLVVDGHFALLAAIRAEANDLPLAVFAFVCDDETHVREQFLSLTGQQRLAPEQADQLIPEVLVSFSPKLSAKEVPVAVCNWLNESKRSPFCGLVKRTGKSTTKAKGVVPATAITRMIDESLSTPSGCLFPYRNIATSETDVDGICRVLMLFWMAVRNVFPNAWGKPESKSGLMRGAGIRAMGRLMDRLMPSIDIYDDNAVPDIEAELRRIAPICRWTSGTWEELDIKWNNVQNVPRHIHALSNILLRAYAQTQRSPSKGNG